MPSYRIDPFDLSLFAAVVEHGSITAGAKAVHLSLAAASERLQSLEHALGAQLLRRSRRGARPTDAGLALQRYAGRVLRELDSLYSEMAPFARGVRGTVRLLANTAAISEYLPEVLGAFLARHPDVDVDLRERWSHEILELLREGKADVGVLADSVDTTGLAVQPFREDELVLVAPRGRVRRRAVSFVDVLGQPFVGLTDDSGLSRFLQEQAVRCGTPMHHRTRVKGFDAVITLVAQGAGCAIVPRAATERHAHLGVEVVRLRDPWARRRLLLCMPAGEPRPYVREFVQALLAPARSAL
ncbi:MAG TPA: LysR family transcriptional regulator [Burkholderiaceae bacterium]|nr:LysR family transcriptional regulator [Burkholderiaceae bacterium]